MDTEMNEEDIPLEDVEEEGMPENMEEVPDESWLTLAAHSKDVFTLTLNRSGTQLLSGGEDDKAVVWDLEQLGIVDPIPHHDIANHSDSVVSVSYNASETMFSTADMSGKIQLFDAKTGEKFYDIDYCDDLEWTVWHPQADILLAGSADGQVFMFLLSTKQIEKVKNLLAVYADGKALQWCLKDATYSTCNLRSPCTALDVHPDLPLVAVGTESGLTHIINTTNMKSVTRLGAVEKVEAKTAAEEDEVDEQGQSVEAIRFAPGYPWLAVGSADGRLVIYDYETSQPRHECAHDKMAVVKCCWWKPDADRIRILSACIDGAIRCWDARSGEPLLFKCGAGQELFDMTIALVKNQPLIFAACAGGLIRVYQYEESKLDVEEQENLEQIAEDAIVEEMQ